MTQTFSARIRLGMAAAALLAPFASGARAQTGERTEPALKDIYARHFLIGAAINPPQITTPDRAEILRRHFNSITAANMMKPNYLTNARGEFTWERADLIANFAQQNGMQLRGHTLLWHSFGAAPDWFFEGGNASVIRRRLETYIHDVVTHFRGKIYAWDVVNEVASDGETTYREDSRWYRALGPDYIEWCFRAAHDADPNTLLFINDYDTEEERKGRHVMTIVDDLISKGVPLHGVGHQLHLKYPQTIDGVRRIFRETEARNLINHVTELDVSVYNDPGSCFSNREGCEPDFGSADNIPPERMAQQVRLYRELFTLFREHESLTSVTLWGLTDQDSWLNGFPARRTNAPLLFDRDGRPKPAFDAIARPSTS